MPEDELVNSQLHSQVRLARTRASKLVRLAQQPAYWPAARQGVVASVEHASVPFRNDVRTVLDVGASRGQFSLHARQRFPSARIICFEPLPDARSVLGSVLGNAVEIRPTAVGAEAGTATLHVAAQDDSSSLLPIGRRQVHEFPGTFEASTIEVDVTTLAAVLTEDFAAPVLLKIDVQGLELEVLRGAAEAIEKIDEVFVECSFTELYEGQAMADEVVAYLLERGMRLVGVYGISYAADGAALQADLLFRR